jgi:hypothetical protein
MKTKVEPGTSVDTDKDDRVCHQKADINHEDENNEKGHDEDRAKLKMVCITGAKLRQ